MKSTNSRPGRSGILGPAHAAAAMIASLALTAGFLLRHVLDGVAYVLVERSANNLEEARGKGLVTDDRELGNVITDNLGMIVFGILAIVVIGGLISGLGTAVINWVTKQLGV